MSWLRQLTRLVEWDTRWSQMNGNFRVPENAMRGSGPCACSWLASAATESVSLMCFGRGSLWQMSDLVGAGGKLGHRGRFGTETSGIIAERV